MAGWWFGTNVVFGFWEVDGYTYDLYNDIKTMNNLVFGMIFVSWDIFLILGMSQNPN